MTEPIRTHTVHVGIVKGLLISIIRNEGAAAALYGWTGTDAEAIAAVQADPRDVFVLDATCTRRAPDGACLGHYSDEDVADTMTAVEAAAFLRVSVKTVWRYIADGRLEAKRLPKGNGPYRIAGAAVRGILAEIQGHKEGVSK